MPYIGFIPNDDSGFTLSLLHCFENVTLCGETETHLIIDFRIVRQELSHFISDTSRMGDILDLFVILIDVFSYACILLEFCSDWLYSKYTNIDAEVHEQSNLT